MCFSATASFVTAGATAAVGAALLTKVSHPRELPLAAMPIFFALQQSVEGLLWLQLPVSPQASLATGLTLLFLLLAQVFWPIYAPVSMLLVEPDARRRTLMYLGLVAGVGVGLYFLWSLLTQSHSAVVRDGHIVYAADYEHSDVLFLLCLAATSAPFILSSHRVILALGAVIVAGSIAAYVFYWEAFVSVWCFFAAAASVVLLYHFEVSRRQRLRIASA